MGSLRPSSSTAVTDAASGRSARMITPVRAGVRAEHRVRVVVLSRDDPFDLAQARASRIERRAAAGGWPHGRPGPHRDAAAMGQQAGVRFVS